MAFRLFQRLNGLSSRVLFGHDAGCLLSNDCGGDPERRKREVPGAFLFAKPHAGLAHGLLPNHPSSSSSSSSPTTTHSTGTSVFSDTSLLSSLPTSAGPNASSAPPALKSFGLFGVSSLRDLNPRLMVPAETTAASLSLSPSSSCEAASSLIPTGPRNAGGSGYIGHEASPKTGPQSPRSPANYSHGYTASFLSMHAEQVAETMSVETNKNDAFSLSPTSSGYAAVTSLFPSISLSSPVKTFQQPLPFPSLLTTMSEKARRMYAKRKEEVETLPNRDWNREFNEIFRLSVADRSSALKSLYHDFVQTASRIGETIIRERNLPIVQKVIHPFECAGVAGGEKFLKKGIFFKYAIDKNNFYGSDEAAMKVAGHELKSYTAMVSCGMSMGLHFGLMTIIDFRGFRLLATSKLPISSNTLKYGSADGGNTVHADVPELNDLLKKCANILNLKGHFAGISDDPSQRRFLHGPCDIEGHLGRDGKFYVIDLSRLFPPETPNTFSTPIPATNIPQAINETNENENENENETKDNQKTCRSFLYRLLRPELVRRNKQPLSSDAFTLFGRDGHEEHDQEVRETTQLLREKIIPDFALNLCSSSLPSSPKRQIATERTVEWLLDSMHRHGINFRYLGAIRNECLGRNNFWSRLILTEILARTLKSSLRSSMRNISASSDLSCFKLVASFCNDFLIEPYCRNNPSYALPSASSSSPSSSSSPLIWTELTQRFGHCALDSETESEAESIVDLVFSDLLFKRVLTLVGIELSDPNSTLGEPLSPSSTASQMQSSTDGQVMATRVVSGARRLSDSDIISIVGRHKQIYLIPRIEADSAAEMARRSHDPAEISRLLAVARDNYARVLHFKPDDYVVLSNLGTVLVALAKLETDPTTSSQLFAQAYSKFRQSLSVKPDDETSVAMWADACIAQALWMIKHHPKHPHPHHEPTGTVSSSSSSSSSSVALRQQVEKLLKCAETLSMKAESLVRGSGSYNLARVMALRNKENLCHQWLLRSFPRPSRDQLLYDPSLLSVSSTGWFHAFVSSLP